MIDPEQDALLGRLARGELGPWGAQGFIPGGITVLRPDTGQWENIYYTPGDADLVRGEPVGNPVDVSGLELDPDFTGNFTSLGGALGTSVGAGGPGHPLYSVVAADSYGDADFVRTDLGTIRMTVGISNGVSGPLSPIQMGTSSMEVNRDGNLWLPKVRFGK